MARAISLVPPDSHAAGRLLSRYGHILGVEEGDFAGAREAVVRALAIARREEDPVLEMRILADAARLDRTDLRPEESLRKSLRAIELAVSLDDIRTEVAARYEAYIALAGIGDQEGYEKQAKAMLDGAERLRDRQLLSNALLANGNAARKMGDWRAAREFYERGLAVWNRDSRHLAQLAEIEYQVGNFV